MVQFMMNIELMREICMKDRKIGRKILGKEELESTFVCLLRKSRLM